MSKILNFQFLIANEILQELGIIAKKLLVNINHEWPMGKGERKLLGTIWSYLTLAGDRNVQKNCVDSISHSSMTICIFARAFSPVRFTVNWSTIFSHAGRI